MGCPGTLLAENPLEPRRAAGSGHRHGMRALSGSNGLLRLKVMKQRLLVPTAALSVLAGLTFTVAACGGGTAKPAPTVPTGALEVDAVAGLKFDKSEYIAIAGTVRIAYLNKDSQRHTLVVKDAAGVLVGDKLEVVRNNDLSTGTFQLAPGTYLLICDVPGHEAMKATLVVS